MAYTDIVHELRTSLSHFDDKYSKSFSEHVGCNVDVMQSIDAQYDSVHAEYLRQVSELDVYYKDVRSKRVKFVETLIETHAKNICRISEIKGLKDQASTLTPPIILDLDCSVYVSENQDIQNFFMINSKLLKDLPSGVQNKIKEILPLTEMIHSPLPKPALEIEAFEKDENIYLELTKFK